MVAMGPNGTETATVAVLATSTPVEATPLSAAALRCLRDGALSTLMGCDRPSYLLMGAASFSRPPHPLRQSMTGALSGVTP